MKEYKKIIRDFELLTEIAYDLSQQFEGVFTNDRRKLISTYILAKVVPNCISILKLLPESKFSTSEDDYLDFSSISSLCRNLIEASNIHWYLSIENISPSEKDFRLKLYDYNDTSELLIIAKNLELKFDDIKYLKKQLDFYKAILQSDLFFKTLNSKLQKLIILGKKSSTLTQFEIAKARKINYKNFIGIYKLLSNQIHTTPASIKWLGFTRLYDNKNEMNISFTLILLDYASRFLADMILQTGNIWKLKFAKKKSKNIVKIYSNKLTQKI